MHNAGPVLLLSTILLLFCFCTLAQSTPQSITPALIAPSGGRVGIINRHISDSDSQVNFWIAGLQSSTRYLEFQAQTANNKTEFLLTRWYGMSAVNEGALPFKAGVGEFAAQWGETTVKCHLEVNPATPEVSNATSKQFAFLPGGVDGSYLWPCGFQDWVQVICQGTEPTCTPGGW